MRKQYLNFLDRKTDNRVPSATAYFIITVSTRYMFRSLLTNLTIFTHDI